MTFEEARRRYLEKLDAGYAAIRDTASDPTWTNEEYKRFVETMEAFKRTLRDILRLNNSEAEAMK